MRTLPKPFLAMILFILTASSAYAEYKLVWSDEFEGPGIDKQIWNHEVYPGVVNRSSLIHPLHVYWVLLYSILSLLCYFRRANNCK